MAKKYENVRLEREIHQRLKRVHKLYEVQDNRDYTKSEIIKMLIEHREKSQFILPLIDNKKEL